MQSLKGESFILFTDALKSQASKKNYVKVFKLFCEFAQMDADALAEVGRKDADRMMRIVADYIRALKRRVEDNQLSAGSVWTYYAAVKLFFDMNDAGLNWKKLARMLPERRMVADDRAYTKEEIQKMLEHADVRDRVIVLLLASSGMRVGAIPLLKFKHITPIYIESGLVSAKVKVYAGSSEEYSTFMTPECWDAIEKYRQYREQHGEKIAADSPVVRQKETLGKPRPLTIFSLPQQLRRIVIDAGLRVPKTQKRYDVKASHGFRKFFKTRAEQVMKPINVEILMGHSTGVSDSYYRPSEQEVLADYLKALPFLSVTEKEVVRHDYEQKIQTEYEPLKKEVAELKMIVSSLMTQVARANQQV